MELIVIFQLALNLLYIFYAETSSVCDDPIKVLIFDLIAASSFEWEAILFVPICLQSDYISVIVHVIIFEDLIRFHLPIISL